MTARPWRVFAFHLGHDPLAEEHWQDDAGTSPTFSYATRDGAVTRALQLLAAPSAPYAASVYERTDTDHLDGMTRQLFAADGSTWPERFTQLPQGAWRWVPDGERGRWR